MAFVFGDRVKESSTTTGTGDFTLEGAAPGFQTFADGIGEGNQTYYVIVNDAAGAWEIGIGTYASGELSRDTVLASTSAGALVDFGTGTKTVGASVSKQFYSEALAISTHPGIDHTGIPGVPDPEQFTATAHEGTDHTGGSFNLLDTSLHQTIDHTLPPLLLQTLATHAALDHTGVSGVNSFDAPTHALTDHSGIPGVPAPEVFDAAQHFVTDHTGIPGTGTSVIDDSVQIEFTSASADNVGFVLPAGSWAVFAYGAYRCNKLGGLTTELRIGSTVVSSWSQDDQPVGWCWIKHFGFLLNQSGTVNIDFDVADTSGNPDKSPVLFAFAIKMG